MANEDILSAASTATEQMTPPQKDLTSFGPTPLVQPPPLPRMQMQPQQFAKAGNEFSTVSGRKRADRQALFSNTANLVKSGADYIQAKKQRALTMSIERLLQAQQGLEEAKAAGNKEGVQKNTAIINDITSDPKMVKQLQKAFNINLFGDGKNKSENQALQEAFKNHKQNDPTQLNPVAQRLQNAQPYRQQLSPEAQAQAMAIKAGLVPKAGEILKAYQDNFKVLMTAKDTDTRNASLEKAAQLRADAVIYHADKVLDAANTRVLGQEAIAEINARSRKYVADKAADTWLNRIKMMKDIAVTTKNPMVKELSNQADAYVKQLKELADDNKNLQTELDKPSGSTIGKFFGSKAIDASTASSNRIKIMTNNSRMQLLQGQLDGVTQKMKTLSSMGLLNMQGLSNDSSGSTGGGSDSQPQDDDEDTGE